MPTSIETLELVAKAIGIRFYTAERTARALREFRRDYWVTGGRAAAKTPRAYCLRISPTWFAVCLVNCPSTRLRLSKLAGTVYPLPRFAGAGGGAA